MTEENKTGFELKIQIQTPTEYVAWLRPDKANKGFIERSAKQRDLDYLIVELRKPPQRSSSGLKKISLRTNNPVVCIFNKWQKEQFETFEEALLEEEPKPTAPFDTQIAIGGAFYAVPAPHEDKDRKKWQNILIFVGEEDNTSVQGLAEQFKFAVRAAMLNGSRFNQEDELKEYMEDILIDYPL